MMSMDLIGPERVSFLTAIRHSEFRASPGCFLKISVPHSLHSVAQEKRARVAKTELVDAERSVDHVTP